MDNTDNIRSNNENTDNRPHFPQRAVITAGMPYGNKELHFGHIGGVFIHADFYARFLRDRIGKDNVIFISGTDCYGSTIETSYNKVKEDGFDGSIIDFVERNHNKQKDTLDKYGISLDLFTASALGESGRIHEELSADVFNKLYESGKLQLKYTKQFYDTNSNMFLNGRQVTGYCPIKGCKSEIAYANECSLGHQYNESDLLNPKSTITGEKPELRTAPNWYFDLEYYRPLLEEWVKDIENKDNTRPSFVSVLKEFLKDPVIYVKKEYLDEIKEIEGQFKNCTVNIDESKSSIELIFNKLADREAVCELLDNNNIRYRTGKTLVPFRISGNIEWGVPVPEKDGVNGFTFWVWPESLWAPISFTKSLLNRKNNFDKDWENWWKSDEAEVYQFIGEDNIYFYGPAEMSIFMALNEKSGKKFTLPNIVANHHILYMKKKASSSGEQKPPKADELLAYYTTDQLKMHFLGFNLSQKSVSFQPQVIAGDENNTYDPVLKEGNLLTNVYNRLIRSCFYTNQKYFSDKFPEGDISDEVMNMSVDTVLKYEKSMYKYDFNKVVEILELYVQYASKYWAGKSKEAGEDTELIKQVLIDCFHMVRVAASLLHPIADEGCEMIREYLNIDERIWDWDYIFEPVTSFIDNKQEHKLKFLEPRVDFFKKHESQLK